jgi:serine/threonine protein phosphatase PrpC
VLSTLEGFVVANLGDSRAILSNGKRITNDHTALSVKELERVYEQGGFATQGRVFGVLSPSRAFGDFKLKSPGLELLPVTHVPEIHIIPRTSDMPRYIVLMCDGIHNVLKDKELALFCEAHSNLHPSDLAACITGEAYKRWSKDNLSCIIIRTNHPSGSSSSLASMVPEPKLMAYSTSSDDKTEFDSDTEEKSSQ